MYLFYFVFVEIHTQVFTHSHRFQTSAFIFNSSLFFEPPSWGTPKWVTPNKRNWNENRANSNNQKYPAMTFWWRTSTIHKKKIKNHSLFSQCIMSNVKSQNQWLFQTLTSMHMENNSKFTLIWQILTNKWHFSWSWRHFNLSPVSIRSTTS